MTKFAYRAKKGPTELIDGTIDAENIDSAVDKIVKLGYVPLDISTETSKPRPAAQNPKTLSFNFYKRIKLSELGLLIRQLSDLVDAGVPLLRVLSVISKQTESPYLQDVVKQMHAFVQDGGTLSEAMAQHPTVFSSLFVNMVKSGELGGNLHVVLNRLAEFTDRDQEIRAKINSSLVYPALMLVVGGITVFVLLTFVIPRLTAMFDDLSESLPLPTVILMGVSGFLNRFWWLIIGALILIFFYSRQFLNSAEGRRWFDTLKLKIPVFGNLVRDVEIGRFARTLGTLLDSGVVIVTALDSVWAVLGNEILKEEIKKVSQEVASGSSLTAALKNCRYFPEMGMNMIAIGEESGHLEHALYKLADSYERQSDRFVKTITSLLEPILIVGIGSVVGFIVIAMLLPIFKMNLIVK